MPFVVEADSEVGAVIVRLGRDFSLQTEATRFRAELHQALDTQQNPVALIFDIRDASLSSRDMLISTDSESQRLLRHPNIRESVVVTDDALVQIAAKGVNSMSFGFIKVRTFPTLEDALEYARQGTLAGQ